MFSIFNGPRVIELTHAFSGPFAARMFADYGAEVLKIEHVDHPDAARTYPPQGNGWSGYYELLNRNKCGLSLDLKNPEHRPYFYELCRSADVVIENYAPAVKQRLQIDYETLAAIQPRLIYASLSGIGQDSARKYYDVLAQAESGLLSLSGLPEMPLKISPSVVDAFSGLMLAFGIAAALLHRERYGIGQALDVTMLGSALHLLESNLIASSLTGMNPERTGNQDNLIAPFGIYRAKDGLIAVAAGNDAQWGRLCDFLQTVITFDPLPFETNALRLQHQSLLTEIIEAGFQNTPKQMLFFLLTERDIPCAPVNSMLDVLQIERLFASGELLRAEQSEIGRYVVPGYPIHFHAQSLSAIKYSPAPQIGQDNVRYHLPD